MTDAIDRLAVTKLGAVSEQMTALWEGFEAEFEGPSGFLAASKERQDAYLARLHRVAERSLSLKDTDLGHYYYSSAALALFMQALQDNKSDAATLALSARVAWLINQGRKNRAGS